MMLHFGTCISHFGADTPCFWSAYSPHWCEAASGLAIALLPWIPFQFVGLLGQVYVFSPMTKDSSFCRTPLSTSSKTTRTNMSFNLSVEFWLMFMGYQPARWPSLSAYLPVDFKSLTGVRRASTLTQLLGYSVSCRLSTEDLIFLLTSVGGCLQLLADMVAQDKAVCSFKASKGGEVS